MKFENKNQFENLFGEFQNNATAQTQELFNFPKKAKEERKRKEELRLRNLGIFIK